MAAELVFVPSPGRGHLLVTIEMAKLLIQHDQRLSVTMLVMKPMQSEGESSYSQHEFGPRIRVIDLPEVDPSSVSSQSPISLHFNYIESHKDHVRDAVVKLGSNLAGIVIDMFCTSMIDVAKEHGIPAYLFFTSGAAILGELFHFAGLGDDRNGGLDVYLQSVSELSISTYKNPVPSKVLPPNILFSDVRDMFMDFTRRYKETKGIVINTFYELESFALKALAEDATVPPVYSIGPILHVSDTDSQNPKYCEIIKWLDEQADSSVVFLCFGSKGWFSEHQVKEIALALEGSGQRFLWSLRKPPAGNKFGAPTEYEHLEEVLPEGFLERTSGTGKVIGWAPQVAVLKHPAIGGFVSHCGWNSTLESLWFGVPIAAWPLYAEQTMNAFELVEDLELAVEIKMDYQKGSDVIVSADVIEKGIRKLMDSDSNVRANVEQMKIKSRIAVADGGSSLNSIKQFTESVFSNIQ